MKFCKLRSRHNRYNFVPPPGIPMNYCAMHRGTGNHAV